MALNAVTGLPQIVSQPLNRDDQNQQRRVYEKPQTDNQENFEQVQQNADQAMNMTQANAQEATQRPQATQESKAVTNEQPTVTEVEVTNAGASKGSLIDLLV